MTIYRYRMAAGLAYTVMSLYYLDAPSQPHAAEAGHEGSSKTARHQLIFIDGTSAREQLEQQDSTQFVSLLKGRK
jgi:hypothetical protein